MAGKDKNIWNHLLKNVPVPINPMIGGDPRFPKGIPAYVHIGGKKIATVLTRDALKKNLKNTSPVSFEVGQAITRQTLKVPNLTAKQLTKMLAEASKRTTKLPASKPPPLKLPGSFGKGGWSAGPPKSNVVQLPRSHNQNTRVNDFMKKLDPNSADYQALKAVTRARTELGKRPSGRDNVIDFKPKPRKARGGKIKKGYSRGGGIRKPKW